MEYTAEQYLDRIENKRLNSTPFYSREEMIDFAEKYAKQLHMGGVIKHNYDENSTEDVEYDIIHLINDTYQVHKLCGNKELGKNVMIGYNFSSYVLQRTSI